MVGSRRRRGDSVLPPAPSSSFALRFGLGSSPRTWRQRPDADHVERDGEPNAAARLRRDPAQQPQRAEVHAATSSDTRSSARGRREMHAGPVPAATPRAPGAPRRPRRCRSRPGFRARRRVRRDHDLRPPRGQSTTFRVERPFGKSTRCSTTRYPSSRSSAGDEPLRGRLRAGLARGPRPERGDPVDGRLRGTASGPRALAGRCRRPDPRHRAQDGEPEQERPSSHGSHGS